MPNVNVLTTFIGLVAIDEESEKIIDFFPPDKNIEKIVDFLIKLDKNIIDNDVKNFFESLKKEYEKIFIEDERLANLLKSFFQEEIFIKTISLNVESILIKNNIFKNIEEYRELAREVALRLLREKLKISVSKRDLMIVHGVNVIEDLNKQINLIYTRCREWYGIHFPELQDFVKEPEEYLKIISKIGSRNNINEEKLLEVIGKHKYFNEIINTAKKSIGIELNKEDEDQIRNLAEEGLRLISLRNKMEDYLSSLMEYEAPNIVAVTGPILGAKLIALAGGLEKLAMLPASTIQIIGAEKALFRFLRTKKGAPKHGVIFQHPYVHTAPKWQRGKIARALAAKISIAAKIDYFSGEYRGSELREMLEKRIKEIKQKYPKPEIKHKKKR
ncbi:MAG: C/D box methylation guide ribonucleoprotein complex aNOP56 subunit [Nitrososphaerota archaeon]